MATATAQIATGIADRDRREPDRVTATETGTGRRRLGLSPATGGVMGRGCFRLMRRTWMPSPPLVCLCPCLCPCPCLVLCLGASVSVR